MTSPEIIIVLPKLSDSSSYLTFSEVDQQSRLHRFAPVCLLAVLIFLLSPSSCFKHVSLNNGSLVSSSELTYCSSAIVKYHLARMVKVIFKLLGEKKSNLVFYHGAVIKQILHSWFFHENTRDLLRRLTCASKVN